MATLHYVIYPSTLGTPTAAQVKAGQNPAGSAATAYGSETALTADGTQTWATLASGLTAATGYKIAFVWTDSGVDSGVVVGTFSTLSTASAPAVAARATESSSGNSTGYSVGLPTGIVAGNLLIAVVTVRGTLDPTGAALIDTPASGTNWSIVGSVASASHRSMVFAKVAEGGDVLALTSGTLRGWSSVAWRVTGAAGVPAASSATGSSDSPDPPSATASGDANRLWLAARSATDSVTATVPTGYTNGQTAITSSGVITTTAGAERTLFDATENPGAFGAGLSADWVAWTIYVDPVVSRSAQADQTVPAPTQSSTASVRASATSSVAVPAPGQTATSSVRASITAQQSVRAPGQGATSRPIVSANANQSVPAPTQVGVAALGSVVVAQADQIVPPPTQAATAAVRASVTGAQAVQAPAQSATVQARVLASADQAVPAPTQTGVATLGDTRTATADQLVPAPTQSATAAVLARATADQAVPAPSQVGIAAQGAVAVAQAIQAVPAPGQVASASVRASMTAAQQVERVLSEALAGVRARVIADQVVRAPIQVGVVVTVPAAPADEPTYFEFAVPADGVQMIVSADGVGWSVPAEATALEVAPVILGTYRKQPADERDIPIDFSEYLDEFGDGDTIATATATSDNVALTVDTVTASPTAVSVWVRGGTNGGSYKVTVTATTVADRVKQVEFRVKVKDY